MSIRIYSDPIALLIRCAETLWPALDCTVVWVTEIEDGALGFTDWPEDGGPPDVCILADQPLMGAVDILAHELAHVATPEDEDHGPTWAAAYEALHQEFGRQLEVDAEAHGGVTVEVRIGS